MPKVTFLPQGITVDAKKGESLLDLALEYGVSIQHACGGCCACTTCHARIESGFENLSQVDEDEAERLEYLDDPTPNSRLCCQAKVMGDVTVQVVNQE